jgi:hypothetical protein
MPRKKFFRPTSYMELWNPNSPQVFIRCWDRIEITEEFLRRLGGDDVACALRTEKAKWTES